MLREEIVNSCMKRVRIEAVDRRVINNVTQILYVRTLRCDYSETFGFLCTKDSSVCRVRGLSDQAQELSAEEDIVFRSVRPLVPWLDIGCLAIDTGRNLIF